MKIKDIVTVEEKEIKFYLTELSQRKEIFNEGFNACKAIYDEKRVGLDEGEIEQQLISCIVNFELDGVDGLNHLIPKTVDLVFIRKNIEILKPFAKHLASALVAKEDLIIVEKE